MHAKVLSVILMLSAIFQAHAQNQARIHITGPAGTDEPVIGALVKVQASNSTEWQEGFTDAIGWFKWNTQAKDAKWIVEISHMAYQMHSDTLARPANADKLEWHLQLIPKENKLNQLVVTGQFAPGSAENAVHQIEVISKEKIENMAAVNLADVLRNQVNVRLNQDNVLGSSMSLQGISGQNVKILIDGVPVVGRMDGNIDLSQINLHDVERIEIVQGPLSVNYGTNALAGTINIITKKQAQTKPRFKATGYYENIGQHNLQLFGSKRIQRTDVALSLGRNYFDGWSPTDAAIQRYQPKVADSSRFDQWKPRMQYFGRLAVGRDVGKLRLQYRGEYFWEEITNRGLPQAPFFETTFDDRYETRRIDNALSITGKMGKGYLNVVAAYNLFQREKNTYFKNLTNLQERLSQESSEHDTTTFSTFMSRGSWSSQLSKWYNFQLGYDVQHEQGGGARLADQLQTLGDYALFGSAELKPIKHLVVKPGVRVSYNTAYKAPITPSLNLKYRYKNWDFRGSYARGFRAPALKELYLLFVDINHNIVGNSDLQAEYSHNFRASAEWRHFFKGHLFKTGIAGFYNQIDNLITLAQVSNTQYSYINVGQFTTQGLNANIDYLYKNWKAQLNGGIVGRLNQLGMQQSAHLTYAPQLTGSVQYTWAEKGLTAATFFNHHGVEPGLRLNEEGDVVQTAIAPYTIWDMTLSKFFLKQKLQLAIGCKNLLNITNIQNTATNVGGVHSSGSTSMPVATGRLGFVKMTVNL